MIIRDNFVAAATAAVVLGLAVSAHATTLMLQSTHTQATQTRIQIAQPLGASVLYDQTGVEVVNVVAQDFPDVPQYSSQIADDFTVTDASGWTVLSVTVQENTTSATDLAGVLYNVSIYADANGAPAAQAECEYIELPATFDAANTVATIAFDQSCFVTTGRHWLSATPETRFDTGGQYYASLGDTGVALGDAPVWQNPGGAWGGACPTWTPLTTCPDLNIDGITATSAMLFQVIGHTGGEPGRINLSVGIALDDGNEAQCGTATELAPAVGDRINFCYTVVNNAPFALNYQSLDDSVDGAVLSYEPITIAPGASFQYNRVLEATTTESRMSTWTASDSKPGYAASASTYDFVEISATGTALDLADDGGADITMPFSFSLYGTTSNQLCINNNGVVLFATSGGCTGLFFNQPLPALQLTSIAIAPFWDDFVTAGEAYYETVGDAPNRRFVVEYFQTDGFDGATTPGYTFETVLNEADGSIDFNYQNVSDGGSAEHDAGISGTVGLQRDARLANQYSFDTASLSDGQNIHWTTANTPISFSTSKRVSLDVGAPIMSALPGPVNGSAAAGAVAVAPLYVLNTGNRDLHWSLLEAPGVAPLPSPNHFVRPPLTKATAASGVPPVAQRSASPSTRQPSVSSVVPAFGMTYADSGNELVALDAATPANVTPIASVSGTFLSGTFVNFDFTSEYVVDTPAGDLYTIDTTDGTRHLIGNTGLATNEVAGGIRWDPTTGSTYLIGAACSDDFKSNNSTLYTIDLSTGATTPIGVLTFTCVADIAIDPVSGQLYVIDTLFDFLFAIDKSNGAFVGGGPLGLELSFAQGLDFDASTGVLYLAGYDGASASMYTVDQTLGTASLIGQIGNGAQLAAFAIAEATPPCTRPSDIPWLSVDNATGTTAPGLYSTVAVSMDATGLAPGSYDATLCVHSNDYLHPLVVIPVNFTVSSADDGIFTDGFDGS